MMREEFLYGNQGFSKLEREPSLFNKDQYFYGHGKLLLTGEYLVLEGAKALALPTKLGQSLSVKYSASFSPKLYWKSFDSNGNLWFEKVFEFWHFDLCEPHEQTPESMFLQNLLRQARFQNKHFLRDEQDVHVETRLGFPLSWGLGSSSTLIYNLAQWAYISPFELLFNTMGGSGYDIACAQSEGPIVYQVNNDGPLWATSDFNPSFKDSLYFVYLGVKQNSQTEVSRFKEKRGRYTEQIDELNHITEAMTDCSDLTTFERMIADHEKIIASILEQKTVKELRFDEYWGQVKSLGAWGGDFVLVTSDRSYDETKEYFAMKGYDTFFSYSELILDEDCKQELLH
jgi:mevalonate kinase